ncbi:hypothetical protein [Gordonia terrae]|uniref:hypothetical protein n=1 Tax=Gordonia terrae TaxID=2055 RepID=UPI003F6B06D0
MSARHHLDAMAEAYDEGYNEGHRSDAVPHNPYRKLIDDRREFVREQVEDGYGTLSYPPTSDTAYDDCENVLGDDNAEWFDAVLDAHDQWHALQGAGSPGDDLAVVNADPVEPRISDADRLLIQEAGLEVDPGAFAALKVRQYVGGETEVVRHMSLREADNLGRALQLAVVAARLGERITQ